MARVPIEGIVFHKSHLRSLNARAGHGQSIFTNDVRVSGGSVNNGSAPGATAGVLDDAVVGVRVVAVEVEGAANARSAISALGACGRRSGRSVDEAGEDGVDEGAARVIGPWLDTSVANVGMADKVVLLGKVEAGGVGGLGHVEPEGDVLEALARGEGGEAPVNANVGGGEGGEGQEGD